MGWLNELCSRALRQSSAEDKMPEEVKKFHIGEGEWCPFLTCLKEGPHDHTICPECGAVRHGNLYCPTCQEYNKTHGIDER